MRESHETESTSLEAGEAAADAERLAVTEEVDRAGDREGRAVRAVEQGAAGHAARRSPRRRGRRTSRAASTPVAGRSPSCARGRRSRRRTSRRSRRGWPRSTRPRTAASASTRSRRGCRTSGARSLAEARRELETAHGRRSRPRGASIARREAERAGAAQRRDELIAAGGDRRRRGDRGQRSGWRCSSARSAAARRDRRPGRAGSRPARTRARRGRSAPGGRAHRDLARRAGARDAARGGAPAAVAPGVADRDPGSLRAVSEGRPRDHAGAPRGGRRRRDQGAWSPTSCSRRRSWRRAVEAVLGERLGNVIVDSHEAGVEAIQFLKRTREGRSSFIPRALRAQRSAARPGRCTTRAAGTGVRGDRRQPTFVPAVDSDAIAAAWPKGDGVRGPMLELIGYDRAVRRGRGLPARRRAGRRGSGARAGAVARDAHDEDDRHARRRGDRSAGRRHRRLARVGADRRAGAEARDPRAGSR